MTHIVTSLVVNYRPTSAYFDQKEKALAKYSPDPFPHWIRGERHFNLVNPEERSVVRFEPGRCIFRTEGHPTLEPPERLRQITQELIETFDIRNFFLLSYTSMRMQSRGSRDMACEWFRKRFLTGPARTLLDEDQGTDYLVNIDHRWDANSVMEKTKKKKSSLSIEEGLIVGPATHDEVAQKRWVEFRADAEGELYRQPHISPPFGILANVKLTATVSRTAKSIGGPTLWNVYAWAVRRAEEIWGKVQEE